MIVDIPYLKHSPKNGWYSYRRVIPENIRYLFDGKRELKVSFKTKDLNLAIKLTKEQNRIFEMKEKTHRNAMEAVGEDPSKAFPIQILRKAEAIAKEAGVHPSQRPVLKAGATPEQEAAFRFKEARWLEAQHEATSIYYEELTDYDQMQKDYDAGVWGSEGYETPYKKPDSRKPETVALQIAMGTYEVTPDVTWQNLLDMYLEMKRPKPNKPKPRNDRQQIKLERAATRAFEKVSLVLPQGMDTPLKELDKQTIRETVRDLWPIAGTRQKNISFFKAAFKIYSDETDEDVTGLNRIFSNIVTDDEARRDKRPRRSFTPEEQGIFIKNVMDNEADELKLLVQIMNATGARNSEVTGLELNDVKLDAEIPNIKYRDNSTRLLDKKGLERSVPISKELADDIKKYLEATELEQILFPYWGKQSSYIQNKLSLVLTSHIENKRPHDIRRLSAYSLRHSFIDKMDAVEMPLGIAMYLTGHGQHDAALRVHKQYGTGTPPEMHLKYVLKANAIENWGNFD